MTLLVSWIGLDSRKISSLNFASDSRISWNSDTVFDNARKVFGCKNYPVIVGYCGDVLFPSIVLSQLIDLADNGMLFPNNSSNEERFSLFYQSLIEQFNNYPSEKEGVTSNSIQILFGSRNGETDFLCRTITWSRLKDTWATNDMPFNSYSDKLFILGSGKTEFENRFNKFQQSNESRTSRGVFQCLCEALENMQDKYCGGSPQLVALYNRFNTRQFGIIHNNKRYLYGVELNNMVDYNIIEWRNKLFEICDGETKNIKPNAQRQPRF